MNAEISIETDRCLLVFDFHQNLDWVRRILEKEAGRFTHLLLGGDYFDGHRGEVTASADEVCDFLVGLDEDMGGRLTVLLGNHDIPYLEACRSWRAGGALRSVRYRCSGHSRRSAMVIGDRLDEGFWRGCRLFQHVNGYLISHAGVAEPFWASGVPLREALAKLDEDCVRALDDVARVRWPILDAGAVRGGCAPVGGLTWLDFDREFTDLEDGPPQILGHTVGVRGQPRERARTTGRSWCLDGNQTCYGLLDREGNLRVEAI